MNRKGMRKAAFVAVVALIISAAASVWAHGIPSQTPLAYSGVLQDSVGNPITIAKPIQLTLWDNSSSILSVNQKCITASQSVTPDGQGRFRIVLDQTCFDAVRSNPNLWVQVDVSGSPLLPRSKINAVPFAVEAGRASRVVLTGDAGISTTVDGNYCGATTNTNGAFTASGATITGYKAAKFLCEQTCTSATAHMCSAAEAIRSYELGFSLPSTGAWVKGNWGIVATTGSSQSQSTDCTGWTEGTSPNGSYLYLGMTYNGPATAPFLSGNYCNVAQPILCCD